MPSHDDANRTPAEPVDDRPGETDLSPEVIAMREAADAEAQRLGPHLDAHIEAVLQNCRIALDALAEHHAQLADRTDLDLQGDTRWAARWQLSGAAIAYVHALVDLSDRGHVDSALPMSRTLYEALEVLGVINDDAGDRTILNGWLEDREIEPKKVRAAAERQAQRVAEEAAAQGIDLGVTGLAEAMKQMYALSPTSAPYRSGLRGMVRPTLRRAVYGPHSDPVERAGGAASTVLAVEATIMGVGDTLAAFYGGPYSGGHQARPGRLDGARRAHGPNQQVSFWTTRHGAMTTNARDAGRPGGGARSSWALS